MTDNWDLNRELYGIRSFMNKDTAAMAVKGVSKFLKKNPGLKIVSVNISPSRAAESTWVATLVYYGIVEEN